MSLANTEEHLRREPRTWLVTGAAGFIGSNLLERLLKLDQTVVGLDNFATGSRRNLDEVLAAVSAAQKARLRFIEGDIRNLATCQTACTGVEFVLHQAALGSVPRSIENPLASHQANVDGFVNMLLASRDAKVARFVYASSSSVYGDNAALPKVEPALGRVLSPYALTKLINEQYATLFGATYGLSCVGLRYFNVFGRRQDPEGAYAAVIPKWIAQLLRHQTCVIHGDGETSRDFCFVENAVQANVLAAMASADSGAVNQVFNVSYGGRTTLSELHALIRARLAKFDPAVASLTPEFGPFRAGDIRHSNADISKAERLLHYAPAFSVAAGLDETMAWYVERARQLA